ncbi:MAG TPA: riboflavin synthase [bacterium]|jgi:riboflavin synthase
MFTGLIQTVGRVRGSAVQGAGQSYQISCRFEGESLQTGESIAVDGVCVTVEAFDKDGFRFAASSETLKRSTLRDKRSGDPVHLERALRLGDRLGGHLVQGHVDGMGIVNSLVPQGNGQDLTIEVPQELRHYVAEKGSIAIQGVSLTVAHLNSGLATVALIPETLRQTYLGKLKAGDRVNIEVDILAKYVESSLKRGENGISTEKLAEWGFTE